MNSQFNVKHNLADYTEQEMFNSTGQIHLSPATQTKLANFYSDYKSQPSYILANSDETNILETNSNTQCKEGYQIVYHIATSEYQCVLESDAKQMIEQNIAENHALIDYVTNKDKLKVYDNTIYEINQKIQRIIEEYSLKNKAIESKYSKNLENEDLLTEQRIQETINKYKTGNLSKEDVGKQILKIDKTNEDIKEKILKEKLDEVNILESEQKNAILKAVKGYENNSDINVDWNYLNESQDIIHIVNEIETTVPIKVSLLSTEDINKIHLDNVDITNSFGQKLDEIKTNQVLQIASDITNPNEHRQDFAYIVEITDSMNILTQPAKWITGTLNSAQTFNVSLSWIPTKIGEYKVTVFIGTDINSVLQDEPYIQKDQIQRWLRC